MSDLRHAVTDDDGMAQPAEVLTFARDYAPGHAIPPHRHSRDQLVYASHGVMTVQTRSGTWVTPADRAIWIPAGADHLIVMSGHVALRSLYFQPGLTQLPSSCCVVDAADLLGPLIAHACRFPTLTSAVPTEGRLIRFLIDQLRAVPAPPLDLPQPADPRARRIAAIIAANPADPTPLARICRDAGTSRRTAERLFLRETGLTIGQWRHQRRLLEALRRLMEGGKVIEAAFEAGYGSPSAFTAAFKRTFGMTPAQYLNLEHVRDRRGLH